MQQFRGALFDFDGVIVDSTPMHLAGWNAAYESLFQATLEDSLLDSLVGRSTAAIGTILAEKSGYPASKSELIKRKASYVLTNLSDIPLIPGSRDFLRQLHAEAIPFGICSNAPRDFIKAALERHGLICPFYLGLEDYVRPKPDPEPYVKGAKRMDMPFDLHGSIAVFEDSTHGIEAAIGAKMYPIGICSQHPEQILALAGAKECYRDFAESGAGLLPRFHSA